MNITITININITITFHLVLTLQAPGAVSSATGSASSSGTRAVTATATSTGTGTGVGSYAEPSSMWKPGSDSASPSEIVYTEGDRVEGDFKEKGVWYPGVISCNRDDGTYNIEYDDNSIFKEYKVPPTRIRRVR